MIVAILNQKGGVGKTTCSQAIAGEVCRRGLRVLIVDTDSSQVVSKWHARRTGDGIDVVAIQRAASLRSTVPELAKGHDLVIIDGAAGISDTTAGAIALADTVLIPVQPSLKDLDGTDDIVALVNERQAIAEGRPKAAFLVTRVKPQTRMSRQVDEALLEKGLPLLDARLHDRQAYIQSDLDGRTVTEYQPTGEAADEVAKVVDELIANGMLPAAKEHA